MIGREAEVQENAIAAERANKAARKQGHRSCKEKHKRNSLQGHNERKLHIRMVLPARLAALLSLLALPSVARAGGFIPGVGPIQEGFITVIPGCDFITGWMTAACIPNFIANAIKIVFYLASTFLIVNIMIAGYQIAFTRTKEDGKARLQWSLTGFAICALSFVIIDAVLDVIV
jgi:hypothetical protein